MATKKDDRLFAPFPIEMDEHPKIIGLSDRAFRAIIEATFYSRRMLTDGFLDERVVLRRWGQDAAEELASNDPNRPSWIRVDGGWQIHDFEKHHPLRAEIEAKRADLSEKRSQAGAKGAASRWQGDSKPKASDSSETETQSKTETEDTPGADRADVMHLCDLLADLIEQNGSKRPTIGKTWLDAARLMIDKDKRDVSKAANLIRWSQASTFWRSTILSMPKFREQYDKLRLQALREHEEKKPRHDPDAWMNS